MMRGVVRMRDNPFTYAYVCLGLIGSKSPFFQNLSSCIHKSGSITTFTAEQAEFDVGFIKTSSKMIRGDIPQPQSSTAGTNIKSYA